MLTELLIKMSDYGHAALSKGIYHFGVIAGIGGGATVNVVGKTMDATQSPIAFFVLEYGGLVTVIAGVSLILKNMSDIVLSWVKARWDRKDKESGKNEQC